MPKQKKNTLNRLLTLLESAETLIQQLSPPTNDWSAIAYHWKKHQLLGTAIGYLQPVKFPNMLSLESLKHIDDQKKRIVQNTLQFIRGYPANNVLLTGSRGTGKSSLIKSLLHEYAGRGLRIIEVSKDNLSDLPQIASLIAMRPEHYILFCDDLSFENQDAGYKALKVALDGSLEADTANLLIYATSNRRHLIPEYFEENLHTQYHGDEIHPADTVEEKISLSERFGLWLSFYPFDQDEYWQIVKSWLASFKLSAEQIEQSKAEALRWALQRGSRSGRVAWQFAKYYVGSLKEFSE